MKLHIKNLKADTIIGVYPEERKDKRQVQFDLEIVYDAVVKKDNLDETLDYDEIEKKILTSLAKQKFQLIESLAEHVAHLVLGMDKVQEVTVRLTKAGALKNADAVIVEYYLHQ